MRRCARSRSASGSRTSPAADLIEPRRPPANQSRCSRIPLTVLLTGLPASGGSALHLFGGEPASRLDVDLPDLGEVVERLEQVCIRVAALPAALPVGAVHCADHEIVAA